ncbi:MAG: flagellar basal body L-ring protein FlgH [Desulfurobacteriaceae bacterium]
MKKQLSFLFFSLLLTSCFSKPQGTVSYTPPPPKLNFQTKPLSEGSLWNDNGRFKYIYGDSKARDVGDLVTILIVEKTRAQSQTETALKKSSKVQGGVSSLFGLNKNVLDKTNVAMQGGAEHGGKGSTLRGSIFTGTVTAQVIGKQPNGNLIIQAQKNVVINGESHVLTITGVVRPEDIDDTNTVTSDRVFNLQITYTGEGVLTDVQEPGFIWKIVAKLWPF